SASLGTKRTPMTVRRKPSAAMRPYNAAPLSASNFAESSFAPTSAATATVAPVRSAATRADAKTRNRIPIHRARTPHSPQRLGSLEPGEERVKQMLRAKADGVVRRKSRLLRDRRDCGAGLVVTRHRRRIHRDADDLRLPRRKRDALVQLDELGQ